MNKLEKLGYKKVVDDGSFELWSLNYKDGETGKVGFLFALVVKNHRYMDNMVFKAGCLDRLFQIYETVCEGKRAI